MKLLLSCHCLRLQKQLFSEITAISLNLFNEHRSWTSDEPFFSPYTWGHPEEFRISLQLCGDECLRVF